MVHPLFMKQYHTTLHLCFVRSLIPQIAYFAHLEVREHVQSVNSDKQFHISLSISIQNAIKAALCWKSTMHKQLCYRSYSRRCMELISYRNPYIGFEFQRTAFFEGVTPMKAANRLWYAPSNSGICRNVQCGDVYLELNIEVFVYITFNSKD